MAIKKINKMLILDYVDGMPYQVFRAEIDIPLGDNFDYLRGLLDDEAEKRDEIVTLLLSLLGTAPENGSEKDIAQNQAARHFLMAAFERYPPD